MQQKCWLIIGIFNVKDIVISFILCAGIFSANVSFCQNQQLKGFIHDHKDPLPFVSVAIKNTGIGTVSNSEGKFMLLVPQQSKNEVISISMIGYKTREVTISNWREDIVLEKADILLPEVSIMPEDSMIRFMERAVDRISENYLSAATRQTGFYRTMLKYDTTYQYFGEALLDVYKPSYRNRESGSVKIINSRISKSNDNKAMPPLYFYGGIYLPFWADFVQQREAFLNPAEFKHYNYSLDEIIVQDGKVVYTVSFKPKEPNKGKYEGSFHIDQKTLTFLDIHFSYTSYGCEQRSRNVSSFKSKLNCLDGSYLLKYALIDNHYFLKYILYSEDFQEEGRKRIYKKTNEYLTSDINRENINPIPLDEQDMLSTVFSVKAISVNESTWKDYNVLTKEPLQLAYSEQQAKQLLLENKSKMSGSSHKEKLIKLVMRMQSSLYLNTVPIKDQVEISSFSYRSTIQHTFQLSKPAIPQDLQVNIGMSIGYNLTNRFSLLMAQETSITSHKWESYSLGFSYNIGLKSYGNRILLSPQLALNSISNGVNIGEYSNAGSFMAGNKKINSDKIKLFLGERAFGIQPGVMIKKDISRTIKLFLGADYCWNFNSQRRLFIEGSSGFLLRRKATISLNRPEITYSTSQPGRETDLFNTSFFNFKAGIIIGR
jgi:hypothetical protein